MDRAAGAGGRRLRGRALPSPGPGQPGLAGHRPLVPAAGGHPGRPDPREVRHRRRAQPGRRRPGRRDRVGAGRPAGRSDGGRGASPPCSGGAALLLLAAWPRGPCSVCCPSSRPAPSPTSKACASGPGRRPGAGPARAWPSGPRRRPGRAALVGLPPPAVAGAAAGGARAVGLEAAGRRVPPAVTPARAGAPAGARTGPVIGGRDRGRARRRRRAVGVPERPGAPTATGRRRRHLRAAAVALEAGPEPWTGRQRDRCGPAGAVPRRDAVVAGTVGRPGTTRGRGVGPLPRQSGVRLVDGLERDCWASPDSGAHRPSRRATADRLTGHGPDAGHRHRRAGRWLSWPTGRVRYRFSPLERRGIIAGWRGGQIASVAVCLVVAVLAPAVAALDGRAPPRPGRRSACGVAVAFWPISGPHRRAMAASRARWSVVGAGGRRSCRRVPAGPRATRPHGRPPRSPTAATGPAAGPAGWSARTVFGGLSDVTGPDGRRSRPRRSGWCRRPGAHGHRGAGRAGPQLRPPRRPTRSPDRRLGPVLASLAREGSEVHRLQWIESCLPDDGGARPRHHERARRTRSPNRRPAVPTAPWWTRRRRSPAGTGCCSA